MQCWARTANRYGFFLQRLSPITESLLSLWLQIPGSKVAQADFTGTGETGASGIYVPVPIVMMVLVDAFKDRYP